MERQIVKCIICPTGCDIQVKHDGNEVISVEGNKCNRGKGYASAECLCPVRVLTTTVKVMNGIFPVASVRTASAIPKEKIEECMDEIKKVTMHAPVAIGDVVVQDIAETGVDVIVTRNDMGM